MQNSRQKDYVWNIAAGIINASEAVIMSMIVTRYGQLSDAGILSLAFALGNVLKAIGVFGGRMFQVTDIKKQYSYSMYLIQRFLTLGLMILTLIVIVSFSGYGANKATCIILIAAIYMIEVIEDCIWGHYQAINLLYVGTQMFCSRWITIFVVFTVLMVTTGNMIWSLAFGVVAALLVFFVWVIVLLGKDTSYRNKGDKDFVNGLTWLPGMVKQIFPLFIAGFCSIFISNIPKFAIDRYLNDEIQACYGFVAMPVFVIGLLNQFIYQPTVVNLTTEYYDDRIEQFKKSVNKQMLIVAGIMALCVCGAALIGIPVLSAIYHTDLSGYHRELVILQFAGGFLGLAGYFNVILTIMRKQKIILMGYLGTLALGIVALNIAVSRAGTVGASVGYLIVLAILFIYYYISYTKSVNEVYNRA